MEGTPRKSALRSRCATFFAPPAVPLPLPVFLGILLSLGPSSPIGALPCTLPLRPLAPACPVLFHHCIRFLSPHLSFSASWLWFTWRRLPPPSTSPFPLSPRFFNVTHVVIPPHSPTRTTGPPPSPPSSPLVPPSASIVPRMGCSGRAARRCRGATAPVSHTRPPTWKRSISGSSWAQDVRTTFTPRHCNLGRSEAGITVVGTRRGGGGSASSRAHLASFVRLPTGREHGFGVRGGRSVPAVREHSRSVAFA